MSTIDFANLSLADKAALFAALKQEQENERNAAKAEREASKGFLAKFVGILVKGAEGVPAERTMKSGAVGWTLGGSKVAVDMGEGVTRFARVSVLVRWEDTIPASETD